MQAITTKYAGPTNTRGPRIVAKAAAGSLTVGYDHALSIDDNHAAAAQALVEKLGWTGPHYGTLVSGCNDKGDFVHVITKAIGALRALTEWACTGEDRYESQNPYSRPVVKKALKTLAEIDGIADYLDVNLKA